MVELLSPAGDINSMYAAFAGGADAVYAGADEFSARAYSANFDTAGMVAAIDYAHILGKKLYLTLNILMKEKELERLNEFIEPFYRAGLDGCIVQDLGAAGILLKNFPRMEVHGSTQLSIANVYGARYCEKKGMTRVVTARELSLEEIKNIRKNSGIEIEVFIHGAMCYSYSGFCLFSSFLGGRSGNRGRCAGPCRQPYRTGKGREEYLLSMKDMCTLDILPGIIEAGVSSLKIEGRMKAPEYVYAVTSMYRKYIDRYYSGNYEGKGTDLSYVNQSDRNYTNQSEARLSYVNSSDLDTLVNLYSRGGLSHGYYEKHNGTDMVTYEKGAYKTDYADTFIPKPPKAGIRGECLLRAGEPALLSVSLGRKHITQQGGIVQVARSRAMSAKDVEDRLKKTGETEFEFLELKVNIEGDVFIPNGAINELKRETINKLKKELLSEYRRSL
ncbi:MAG: U32 family peptidase [Lachnospiraceae bacterium]|nr:U32 family peptidase [Lachnospiraceae bacterium]